MSTQKTITGMEAQLITWFQGQVNLVESNTGQRVEKLMLAVDRAQGDSVTIELVYAPVEVAPPEA